MLGIAASAAQMGVSASPSWEESSRLPLTIAEPLGSDPLRVSVHRLKNGLTVYLSPNREVPRISAWIAVRAGSRDDPDDLTGIAHYLEHMFFKGSRSLGTVDYESERPHLDEIERLYEEHFVSTDTASREALYARIDQANARASRFSAPNELSKAYSALGFDGVNAFTSNDRTVYVADLPKNRLEAWARLESDRFSRPVFRLFQTELETVYEEKNRAGDNPERIFHDARVQALYGPHPYARSVLGSIEHLKNPSLKKMYEFQRRYYVPNNMALALAGDFDREEALAVVEKYFGEWVPKPLEPSRTHEIPRPAAPAVVEVRYEAEEKVAVSRLIPGYGHPDQDALTVADMVLANGRSGLVDLGLNQAQRVRKSGSEIDFLNEAGEWILWAVPKDGQTPEEAEALLEEAAGRLKAGDFSTEDLGAILTDFEIREKYKAESNEARSEEMAEAFLRREEWPWVVGRLDRLRKVSKAEVVRVANLYLGEGRLRSFRRRGKPEIRSIAKPGFTKIDIDPGRESAFFKELVSMQARPIEPRWLKEGRDFTREKAPFGEVIAAKNPFNDLFSLDFRFERGFRRERELCAALRIFDLSGAGAVSAEDFKKRLYALGTTLSVSCGERESSVSLSGLDRNLEESLRLMRLRFSEPNFSSDTLRKMAEVEIGRHKDNKVNPGAVANALEMWARRGPESPVLAELTDAELLGLKEERMKKLIQGVFSFEQRLGYVGNRRPREVIRLASEGFPGDRVPLPPPAGMHYRHPDTSEVLFTHRDMIQSRLGVFSADGDYDPARHLDYRLYGDYMGSGMGSVFFQELRESRALAYSAGGGYETATRAKDENLLFGRAGTQADKTIEAASVMLGLFDRFPASEKRFSEVKRGLEESYRCDPVKFRDIPGTVEHWEDMGFSQDPRPERFKRLSFYTLRDLEGFAGRFRGRPMTLHILGNRSRVDMDGLKKFGALTEVPVDSLFPY
jgi:predicted Zn-dependent peptidase